MAQDLVTGGRLSLLRATRAHALLAGRDYASPDDVQAVAAATLAHRLTPVGAVQGVASAGRKAQLDAMIQAVGLV